MLPERGGNVFTKFGSLSFQIIVHAFKLIKSGRPDCNFNKFAVVQKFTIIVLSFTFPLQPVRVILFQNIDLYE
jgi:hypothetical protein